jgi:cyclophilin family peptidyl-prolyl cis-trans isomerase
MSLTSAVGRLGTLLVLFLPTCALIAAQQGDGLERSFICGQDQSLPSLIDLSWTAIVLAGDGRLYSPCPGGSHGVEHRERREAVLIGEGRLSADGEIRWRAAQAQARNSTRPQVFPVPRDGDPPGAGSIEFVYSQLSGLGGLVSSSTIYPACRGEVQIVDAETNFQRWQPGRLFRMLDETRGFAVRAREGVRPQSPTDGNLFAAFRYAMAREGAYAIGVQLSRPGLDPHIVTAATKDLRACLLTAGSTDLAGLILEDLGLARYGKEDEIRDAEGFLVLQSYGTTLKTLGATKGLEALMRQNPQHQIGDVARDRLRQLVGYGARTVESQTLDSEARIRRLAMLALQSARALDYSTLQLAATDADWQVRRLAAAGLNFSDPQMAGLGDALAGDRAFQVRYELLSPLSRNVAQTHECAPIAARFKDPSPTVVMRAMDLLPASCTDLDEVIPTLVDLAERLGSTDSNWHVNSRALTALTRIKPTEAKPRMAAAVGNAAWQVRAAAAASSGLIADEASAKTLVRDSEANVQTAALDALLRMQSAAVVPEAIRVLRSGSDYQLLRMAASVLRSLPDASKDEASDALLIALRKLTDQESDTSRDSRIAILDRLAATLSPARSAELLPFAGDFDDEVNAAVTRAFTKLVQTPPAPSSLKRRYPYQPKPAALSELPSQAFIQLEDGLVTLNLLKDVAPVTIARFAELVTRGYYNGLTFHRVVPNFVVQGGSPGANEYSGTTRFMRDEVGPQGVHVRGAVGISTRGNDTGDGQIFIDLVDLPRLDRDYTVFAYVTDGMKLIDNILEGAKIVSITVKR